MNKQPHIFLDIDGVLATSHQYGSKKLHPKYNCYPFDKKCVIVFNEIIEKIKPEIILSSDWKFHYNIEQMNEIFNWNGIDIKITDTTPNLWGTRFFSLSELENCRASEILLYATDYELTNYVAIDDLNLSKWIPNNFVHTPRANEGIKQSGVKEKIINKLIF